METIWNDYPLVVVGVLAVLLLLWLVLRPRQRVSLSDSTPLRPHMAMPSPPRSEGQGIADEHAAATGDIAGEMISARVHENLPGASGPPDDLKRLKGVGPKMASLLNLAGITRFDQIAKLSHSQVEAIDLSLGAFRGRFSRDRIVEQSHYLARGDHDGFEQHFGKL